MTTMVWPPNWDRKSGLTSYTLSLQICHRGPRWPPFNGAHKSWLPSPPSEEAADHQLSINCLVSSLESKQRLCFTRNNESSFILLGRWDLSLFVIFLYLYLYQPLYLCLLWCFYLCLFFAFATRLKSHQPICVDVWPGAVWHPMSSVSVSRQRLSMSTKTVNQQSAASGGKNWFKDGSKYCHGTIYNNKRIAALSINQPE